MALPISTPFGNENAHNNRESTENSLPDSILLERSANGDRNAFSELALRYFHTIYATALAILGNPQEAEDACQDALIKAYKYIRTLKDRNKFGCWLRSIVRQESYTKLQKKNRTLTVLKKISKDSQTVLKTTHSDKQRRMYHQQLFHHAIQALSEKAKEIVLLYYVSGLSCEEIAVQTGTRTGTIKSHLFKARQKMLGHLSEIGVHSIEDI